MLNATKARTSALALVAILALGACSDDDPVSPTREEVAGTYAATTFTLTAGGVEMDLLEEGSSLDLTLNADGTTEGRVFVPGMDDDGGDFVVDLTGTYTISGDRVRITTGEDVFIDDVDFRYASGRLSGSFTGTERVVVVLERS